MRIQPENQHYFKEFKIGTMTDKGEVSDLFFLNFEGNCTAWKSYTPEGKGLLMARVGKKDYAIGELKILDRI